MSASDAATGHRPARNLAVFQGIVILVALLVVWLAWDFVQEDGKAREEASRRQVAVTADLAVSEIRSALSGAADSLQILSRLPELRDMRRYGPAVALAGNLHSTFLSFAADLAFFQP
ncbi:MAG TPA: hypothetical protein PKM25_04820, partial [Candidatus Ozemobacteraceae bacterium]|nr:hypothetical protein [Candidatus Ozemobacteraceae bacterium]